MSEAIAAAPAGRSDLGAAGLSGESLVDNDLTDNAQGAWGIADEAKGNVMREKNCE